MNWIRRTEQSMLRASDLASIVLPTPGTSSISRWPSASSTVIAELMTSGLPSMTRLMLPRTFSTTLPRVSRSAPCEAGPATSRPSRRSGRRSATRRPVQGRTRSAGRDRSCSTTYAERGCLVLTPGVTVWLRFAPPECSASGPHPTPVGTSAPRRPQRPASPHPAPPLPGDVPASVAAGSLTCRDAAPPVRRRGADVGRGGRRSPRPSRHA